ncbi:hypothetical protein ACJX0J_038958, partial [Zea mays]
MCLLHPTCSSNNKELLKEMQSFCEDEWDLWNNVYFILISPKQLSSLRGQGIRDFSWEAMIQTDARKDKSNNGFASGFVNVALFGLLDYTITIIQDRAPLLRRLS